MARKQSDTLSTFVTTAQAVTLLGLESAAELHKLAKDGWIASVAGTDQWELSKLVQGAMRHARTMQRAATIAQLATTWGLTERRVRAIAAEGLIKPIEGYAALFDWQAANAAYIGMLKKEHRPLVHGEAKVREARAREIEVRTEERLGRLIEIEEHYSVVMNLVGAVRAAHVGFSARITRDLEVRRHIDRELDAVDEGLAETVTGIGERVRQVGAHLEAAEVLAAERLGETQSQLSGIGSDPGGA